MTLTQFELVSPVAQLKASSEMPLGQRNQSGERAVTNCWKFVLSYSRPVSSISVAKPANPWLNGIALVVAKATTTLVFDWARVAGVSQRLLSRINKAACPDLHIFAFAFKQDLRLLTEDCVFLRQLSRAIAQFAKA